MKIYILFPFKLLYCFLLFFCISYNLSASKSFKINIKNTNQQLNDPISDFVKKNNDWTISLQCHKYMNIP